MRMMNRLQGWLAERIPWVQYPPERDARFSARARFRSDRALPLDVRLGIGLLSLFWVLVLLVVAGVIIAVVWAAITS